MGRYTREIQQKIVISYFLGESECLNSVYLRMHKILQCLKLYEQMPVPWLGGGGGFEFRRTKANIIRIALFSETRKSLFFVPVCYI